MTININYTEMKSSAVMALLIYIFMIFEDGCFFVFVLQELNFSLGKQDKPFRFYHKTQGAGVVSFQQSPSS